MHAIGFKCPGCEGIVTKTAKNVLLCRAADSAGTSDAASAGAVKQLCHECDDEATHVCHTCGLLCEDHNRSHSKGKSTKNHSVELITDASAHVPSVSSPLSVDSCKFHPGNPLAQYCFKCRVGLCMHCDLQHHFTECRKVKSVIDALPELRESLKGHCNRLSHLQHQVSSVCGQTRRVDDEF
jgi:hypothetical protein